MLLLVTGFNFACNEVLPIVEETFPVDGQIKNQNMSVFLMVFQTDDEERRSIIYEHFYRFFFGKTIDYLSHTTFPNIFYF